MLSGTADESVGRRTFECVHFRSEVVGTDEAGTVVAQLLAIIAVQTTDGGVLDGAVQPA